MRLKVVEFKNRKRLRKNRYDQIIAPSRQVKKFLKSVVKDPVAVIGHGVTSDLQKQMAPPHTRRPQATLRLLTVGGYAPHKRQHIIPETALLLQRTGVDFIWEVAGPTGRVRGYFDEILKKIRAYNMEDRIILYDSVPFRDLGSLYDRANLYIQPSTEEGFCLTALDAAAAGLPVIGCPAGALPQIVAASGGKLVSSCPQALSSEIASFVKGDCWQNPEKRANKVKAEFSWAKAATQLKSLYDGMRNE